VWNNYLCSVTRKYSILVWKDYNEKVLTLTGHTALVLCLAPAGEYLFSGSNDKSIIKWNEAGQCLRIIHHHTDSVRCLLVFNGELYSGSDDKSVKRISLEGQLLEEYKGHTDCVTAITVWRGALFSGGMDKKVIQWTPFHLWSAVRHKEYSPSIKEGIKTMMMLASSNHFPSHAIPTDVLFIIFQFFASPPTLQKKRTLKH
jgi:WD40 repeat protein